MGAPYWVLNIILLHTFMIGEFIEINRIKSKESYSQFLIERLIYVTILLYLIV